MDNRAKPTTGLLGVDYGEARTGLARSDALGLYAVGMGHIKSYRIDETAAEIVRVAKENGIRRIVIGNLESARRSLKVRDWNAAL